MPSMTFENSFLLNQFHEFYSEVIRQKRMIRTYAEQAPGVGVVAPPSEEDANAQEEERAQKDEPHGIHLRLLSLLEEQALEAGQRGGEYGVNFYREAQYIMAALADEIFLHMDWEGRETWKANLLEFKLFGTHTAGEQFFQKLDRLLTSRDPSFVEMAAVYLQALSLGFRGKFRDTDDRGKLSYYRRQLFAFIFHKSPDLNSESKRLFPETYSHTLVEGAAKRLPYLKNWIALILLLIILYLAISHGIWTELTTDLKRVIQQILSGGSLT
ncbi:MAG: DotU family type IV/VI secretion system protein [Deltaproteobacteria bacterium]|nr:DotU family type IV/VI secretion system protein [Deltaproteobacteria bacterium]